MQNETRLQKILRCTLESLRNKEYSKETLRRYQKKFHVLDKIAQSMNIYEPSEELFNAELAAPFVFTKYMPLLKVPSFCRAYSICKEYGSMLYDLRNDPGQSAPINDPLTVNRLQKAIYGIMKESDAPEEAFARFGFKK